MSVVITSAVPQSDPEARPSRPLLAPGTWNPRADTSIAASSRGPAPPTRSGRRARGAAALTPVGAGVFSQSPLTRRWRRREGASSHSPHPLPSTHTQPDRSSALSTAGESRADPAPPAPAGLDPPFRGISKYLFDGGQRTLRAACRQLRGGGPFAGRRARGWGGRSGLGPPLTPALLSVRGRGDEGCGGTVHPCVPAGQESGWVQIKERASKQCILGHGRVSGNSWMEPGPSTQSHLFSFSLFLFFFLSFFFSSSPRSTARCRGRAVFSAARPRAATGRKGEPQSREERAVHTSAHSTVVSAKFNRNTSFGHIHGNVRIPHTSSHTCTFLGNPWVIIIIHKYEN